MVSYALIGDLHSQIAPLQQALEHCENNNLTPIFLGDIFDSRCDTSDSAGVYRTLREAQTKFPGMKILRSNHQNKLERWLKGNNVFISTELRRTLEDFSESDVLWSEVDAWLNEMPYGFCFRDSLGTEYRCAHAFFPSWVVVPQYSDTYEVHTVGAKARGLFLFGPNDRDSGERITWWERHSDRDWVRVAGHYHVIHLGGNSLVIDGGCGGVTRSWWCEEPPELCLYEVENKQLLSFFG